MEQKQKDQNNISEMEKTNEKKELSALRDVKNTNVGKIEIACQCD
jgi:hypothetical protein